MTKWARRLVWAALVVGTLAVAALLGASSVRTWIDQNEQRAEEERVADDLEERIGDLEAEIEWRNSDEAVRQAALCFGLFVEPGTEAYSVTGLAGCAGQSQAG